MCHLFQLYKDTELVWAVDVIIAQSRRIYILISAMKMRSDFPAAMSSSLVVFCTRYNNVENMFSFPAPIKL